jgi:2-polyprenyl-3-methyl-5-hydroxy-6-metoxy-1,4-benzoquinol methylase
MAEWHKTTFADHELEYLASCDLCGAPSNKSRKLFAKSGLFVVRCPHCGLMYVNTRLRQDILWQRYSWDFFVNEYLPQHGDYDEQLNFHIHLPILRELHQLLPRRGCLLDVGCAIGLFLAAARLDGWEVMGNELSSFAADYARKQFGIPVIIGDFETLNLSPDSFDAVTMWDTLEHLRSPQVAIRKAAQLLRPGGVLALSTPNCGGISFRLLQDRWWIVAPKEHLFYFTPKTISHLLNQNGFKVVLLRTRYIDFRYLRYTLLGRTVMPWHIYVTEKRSQKEPAGTLSKRGAAFWSKLKPRVVGFIAEVLIRMNWADSMFVYAIRQT